MKDKSPRIITRRRLLALALLSLAAAPAFAADNGCYHSANGYYEIQPPSDIIVNERMAPGEVIRDYAAHGKGNVLATCMAGTGTLEGGYIVPATNGLVPLTVGGVNSGFGVRLSIIERGDEREFPFPHRYTRQFTVGQPIRTSDADMRVVIERMSGPVAFGRADVKTIAQQWSYQPGGGAKTAPFRHVSTTNIVFARATCSLVPDDLNQTVKFAPLSLSAFGNPERATPWQAFHIGVQDCEDPKNLIARFTFGVVGDSDTLRPELFSLRGPQNVGLEIATEAKKTIEPTRPVDMPALGSGERYAFFTRLRETQATVRAGVFARPVKVVVEYQ
jgi:type 1 fimbria pilin